MTPQASVVIPAHGHAALTARCIEAIFATPSSISFELVAVDDASGDATAETLASYGDDVRVVTRPRCGGFAVACNDGARSALGSEYLVFLNNDTVPRAGWLDALVREADRSALRAVVGGLLLYPGGTVQHAGVTLCRDGWPRNLYAGFPANHPAVSRARTLKAVTGACMLVRRELFEAARGFDETFKNGLEDVDLCLRLCELGYEIRYTPACVIEHLESVTRGRRGPDIVAGARLFKERWADRIQPDDLELYAEDGLINLHYDDTYPVRLRVSPQLAVPDGDHDLVRELRHRVAQSVALLRENVRLSAALVGRELGVDGTSWDRRVRPDVEVWIDELEGDLVALQRDLGVGPGDELDYRESVRRLCAVVEAVVPNGETVLVASRGDDDLLRFSGRQGWHFPQAADGCYAGHHPADTPALIAELDALVARGARYLVIPQRQSWWLDCYEGLHGHLDERGGRLDGAEDSCLVFALTPIERRSR